MDIKVWESKVCWLLRFLICISHVILLALLPYYLSEGYTMCACMCHIEGKSALFVDNKKQQRTQTLQSLTCCRKVPFCNIALPGFMYLLHVSINTELLLCSMKCFCSLFCSWQRSLQCQRGLNRLFILNLLPVFILKFLF